MIGKCKKRKHFKSLKLHKNNAFMFDKIFKRARIVT